MDHCGFQDIEDLNSAQNDSKSEDVIDDMPNVTKRSAIPSLPNKDDFLSTDGTADRRAKRIRLPVAAIFVHAGAGFHSPANERMHLDACNEACRLSIRILRSGGSAVEAVEIAIKTLEDNEITNCGYGSNLAIDGTVECDATIVDHLGRSGACGAVPNIGNPISLAKVILQRSNTPLSLRRVPPNLLMGDGAKEFARESGIPLIRNEFLVSRNARDRFFRWQEELRRAESQRSPSTSPESYTQASDIDYDNKIRQAAQRDHTNAILTGTWNEGQPDSPGSPWRSPTYLPGTYSGSPPSPPPTSLLPPATTLVHGMRNLYDPSHPRPKPWLGKESTPSSRFPPFIGGQNNESFKSDPSTSASNDTTSVAPHDGACSNDFPTPLTLQIEDTPTTTATSHYVGDQQSPRTIGSHQNEDEDDNITDTVGAIAIDQSGRIAAGSSSGGIGMKHRGRIGPAALVGIGTAVIPADEHDPDGIAVAAVTSGTGEHMATTMASQKCAERIYQSTRRGPRGKDIDEDDESLVLEGFIINDFQEHPGVKQSTSAGAIGVMAVKKSSKGYYLYFAHNTDSFALASMSSNDREPACVMSRNSIGSTGYANGIAQGARKIHI